jgi:hypothetical protein
MVGLGCFIVVIRVHPPPPKTVSFSIGVLVVGAGSCELEFCSGFFVTKLACFH